MRTLPRHVPANRGRNGISLAQVRPIVASISEKRDRRFPQGGSSLLRPIHRTALGLDPRATPNPAQAAKGPRVKSEDGPVCVGEMATSSAVFQ